MFSFTGSDFLHLFTFEKINFYLNLLPVHFFSPFPIHSWNVISKFNWFLYFFVFFKCLCFSDSLWWLLLKNSNLPTRLNGPFSSTKVSFFSMLQFVPSVIFIWKALWSFFYFYILHHFSFSCHSVEWSQHFSSWLFFTIFLPLQMVLHRFPHLLLFYYYLFWSLKTFYSFKFSLISLFFSRICVFPSFEWHLMDDSGRNWFKKYSIRSSYNWRDVIELFIIFLLTLDL